MKKEKEYVDLFKRDSISDYKMDNFSLEYSQRLQMESAYCIQNVLQTMV